MIKLYTDGACQDNPGESGIAAVMVYRQHIKYVARYIGVGTNNIAELTAIKVGLEQIKNSDLPVKVFTDSKYCIGVLTNDSWNPKKNIELISEIRETISKFKYIVFEWVKGHNGDLFNEIADSLATKSSITKTDQEFYNDGGKKKNQTTTIV